MRAAADKTPLRDWGFLRFCRLDRPTLQRLHGWLSLPGAAAEDISNGRLAEDVFMEALRFGTFTLADIVDDGDELPAGVVLDGLDQMVWRNRRRTVPRRARGDHD